MPRLVQRPRRCAAPDAAAADAAEIRSRRAQRLSWRRSPGQRRRASRSRPFRAAGPAAAATGAGRAPAAASAASASGACHRRRPRRRRCRVRQHLPGGNRCRRGRPPRSHRPRARPTQARRATAPTPTRRAAAGADAAGGAADDRRQRFLQVRESRRSRHRRRLPNRKPRHWRAPGGLRQPGRPPPTAPTPWNPPRAAAGADAADDDGAAPRPMRARPPTQARQRSPAARPPWRRRAVPRTNPALPGPSLDRRRAASGAFPRQAYWRSRAWR